MRGYNSKRYISQFKTLVLGAGAAGQPVASTMANYHKARYVTGLVDPAEQHYYQPLWTLVGAGAKKLEDSHRQIG